MIVKIDNEVCCSYNIEWEHNHSLETLEASNFRKISPECIERVLELFESGHTPVTERTEKTHVRMNWSFTGKKPIGQLYQGEGTSVTFTCNLARTGMVDKGLWCMKDLLDLNNTRKTTLKLLLVTINIKRWWYASYNYYCNATHEPSTQGSTEVWLVGFVNATPNTEEHNLKCLWCAHTLYLEHCHLVSWSLVMSRSINT